MRGMISCTEFIPAYSELFKYLEQKGGKEAVVAYWRHISSDGLNNLRDEASENGLRGCYRYWTHTLNEEAADFVMELDEEKGVFSIEMLHCPSKGRLLEFEHMVPYYDYCGHCDILYREVLAPLGLDFVIDLSHCDEARCRCTVVRRTEQ